MFRKVVFPKSSFTTLIFVNRFPIDCPLLYSARIINAVQLIKVNQVSKICRDYHTISIAIAGLPLKGLMTKGKSKIND